PRAPCPSAQPNRVGGRHLCVCHLLFRPYTPLRREITMDPTILVRGVRKSFGALEVLTGVDLTVDPGMVHALLGPNGAGKTTLVNILATLVRPDAGTVTVAGADPVRDPVAVRRRIALTGQAAAVDELLTATENIQMMAALQGLGRRAARLRSRELIESFGLGPAASRQVRTYSGGMR